MTYIFVPGSKWLTETHRHLGIQGSVGGGSACQEFNDTYHHLMFYDILSEIAFPHNVLYKLWLGLLPLDFKI